MFSKLQSVKQNLMIKGRIPVLCNSIASISKSHPLIRGFGKSSKSENLFKLTFLKLIYPKNFFLTFSNIILNGGSVPWNTIWVIQFGQKRYRINESRIIYYQF